MGRGRFIVAFALMKLFEASHIHDDIPKPAFKIRQTKRATFRAIDFCGDALGPGLAARAKAGLVPVQPQPPTPVWRLPRPDCNADSAL